MEVFGLVSPASGAGLRCPIRRISQGGPSRLLDARLLKVGQGGGSFVRAKEFHGVKGLVQAFWEPLGPGDHQTVDIVAEVWAVLHSCRPDETYEGQETLTVHQRRPGAECSGRAGPVLVPLRAGVVMATMRGVPEYCQA